MEHGSRPHTAATAFSQWFAASARKIRSVATTVINAYVLPVVRQYFHP
jgi:hypothetical protein